MHRMKNGEECYTLRIYSVLFVQLKKREKHPGGVILAGFKVLLLLGCFLRF